MDKLNQSLDLFTEGLRSDPEIRLDIRKELQSHLEEKIAEETAQGHSNEESLELALKTFGSPVEVADGLAAANRRRMNFRARMRLLAGALLIPAVIICAFVSLGMASSFSLLDFAILYRHGPYLFVFSETPPSFSFDILCHYTPEQKLILYGDRTRKTNVELHSLGDCTGEYNIEWQKAIWERFPDNKIYAANYILALVIGDRYRDRNFILTEITRASQIDQDNALYNYLAAGVILDDACREVELPREDRKTEPQYRFELKDRVLLEEAMREYLTGINKKYCRSYITELLKQRMQIIGEIDSLPKYLERMNIEIQSFMPHWTCNRNIGKYMPEYASILIKEGKKQEALQCLNTWKQFLRHVNSDDGDWLFSVLVTTCIAATDAKKLPPLYEKLGMTEVAKTTALNAELLCKPVSEWKSKQRQMNAASHGLDRGGILANMLLPALGHEFTSEELAPERYAEYVFFQKITLALINLVLIAGMIIAIGAALYWRFRSRSRLLLLAPPPLTVLKFLGIGVILPCVTYFALLQIELLSGYNYGITANFPRFIAQTGLLLLFIPFIILMLVGNYVTARCCELGVVIPLPSGKVTKIVAMTGFGLLGITAFTPLSVFPSQIVYSILIAGATILAVAIISQVVHWIRLLFFYRQYSIYCGGSARMVMLTFALAVLVMTCVFRPVLDWREAEFIRQDKIMFGSEDGCTKIENDVIKELKSAINQALAKISK